MNLLNGPFKSSRWEKAFLCGPKGLEDISTFGFLLLVLHQKTTKICFLFQEICTSKILADFREIVYLTCCPKRLTVASWTQYNFNRARSCAIVLLQFLPLAKLGPYSISIYIFYSIYIKHWFSRPNYCPEDTWRIFTRCLSCSSDTWLL